MIPLPEALYRDLARRAAPVLPEAPLGERRRDVLQHRGVAAQHELRAMRGDGSARRLEPAIADCRRNAAFQRTRRLFPGRQSDRNETTPSCAANGLDHVLIDEFTR